VELVYRPILVTAYAAFRALDLRFIMTGTERIPRVGGAVLASNHVSYLDFIFAGLAAKDSKRFVRFMAKEAVFTNKLSGPLMRGMRHIPVDRDAGMAGFRAALQALKDGEVIGVFPEATISRSYTVKEIKSGAIRLAQATGTPLIPVAVWGGQRFLTKGNPRSIVRHRPISISVGEPIHPTRGDDAAALTEELHTRMQDLLERVQRVHPDQPRPGEDAPWHPAHLGGTAPTLERAAELDEAERRARLEKRRARAT
jgi:1-acyl-sn-glycerol-3-phosphate acyltransferase